MAGARQRLPDPRGGGASLGADAARVSWLCDPHFGVGSDGVLLLSPSEDPEFVAELRIFNPDGSEAELSGNGAREAILYLRRHGWTDADTFAILTAAGPITPTITSELTCSVEMGRASTAVQGLPGGAARRPRDAGRRRARLGLPARLDRQPAVRDRRRRRGSRSSTWRRSARRSKATSSSPTGPTSPSCEIDGSRVRARIFERGVGETLSSGTGASGAAVTAFLRGAPSPIMVELDGGELEVEISEDLDVRLSGWAEPVCAGELSPGAARRARRRLDDDRFPRRWESPIRPSAWRRCLRTCSPSSSGAVADKRAAGIDVISLGIGDPDEPTYPHIVEAMQEAVADPGNQKYPSNRGRAEFREAFADFYGERFGVEIDPETEVIPAIGAKECIYNLCFAFLDPGGVALASDPGYPVYTGGPILAGADAGAAAAGPRARLRPGPRAPSPPRSRPRRG